MKRTLPILFLILFLPLNTVYSQSSIVLPSYVKEGNWFYYNGTAPLIHQNTSYLAAMSNYYYSFEYNFTIDKVEGARVYVTEIQRVYNGSDLIYDFKHVTWFDVDRLHMAVFFALLDYLDNNTIMALIGELAFYVPRNLVITIREVNYTSSVLGNVKALDINVSGWSKTICGNFTRWENITGHIVFSKSDKAMGLLLETTLRYTNVTVYGFRTLFINSEELSLKLTSTNAFQRTGPKRIELIYLVLLVMFVIAIAPIFMLVRRK